MIILTKKQAIKEKTDKNVKPIIVTIDEPHWQNILYNNQKFIIVDKDKFNQDKDMLIPALIQSKEHPNLNFVRFITYCEKKDKKHLILSLQDMAEFTGHGIFAISDEVGIFNHFSKPNDQLMSISGLVLQKQNDTDKSLLVIGDWRY